MQTMQTQEHVIRQTQGHSHGLDKIRKPEPFGTDIALRLQVVENKQSLQSGRWQLLQV